MEDRWYEDPKNIKKMLFLATIVIALLVMLVIFLLNRGSDYILISESLILDKNYNQIKKIPDDMLKQEYTVVTNSSKYNNILLNYSSSSWYYLNKNYSDAKIKKPEIAYTKGFKDIKLGSYESSYYEDTDYEVIKKVLGNDKNVADFKNSVFKITFDFDNDGKLETIYTLTNVSLEYTGDKENYSTIFMKKNDGSVVILDKDTKEPYLITSVLDLDGDNKYELVVSKGTVDNPTFDTSYQIYKIGNNVQKMKDFK